MERGRQWGAVGCNALAAPCPAQGTEWQEDAPWPGCWGQGGLGSCVLPCNASDAEIEALPVTLAVVSASQGQWDPS